MKFDAIVGNPPYNIVINDKSSQAKPIYINATFLRFAGRKAGDRATRITAFAQSQ